MITAGERLCKRFRAWFGSGIFVGVILMLCMMAGILYILPHWLVITADHAVAEAAVVLGGGGGERLRHAVGLYDQKLVRELILVGRSQRDWEYIVRIHCSECDLKQRRNIILDGSRNTSTDAEQTLDYCRKKKIRSVFVITDPYHTRRADLTFRGVFQDSGIRLEVGSSQDYGNLLKPNESWWRHQQTLETVWLEFGKIIFVIMEPLMPAKSLQ